MSARFDCGLKPGVHCKSISEVNTLVDEGVLPKKPDVKKTGCLNPTGCTQQSHSNDETLSIWMAPFKDATGIQHSDAYLTLPVENPSGRDK